MKTALLCLLHLVTAAAMSTYKLYYFNIAGRAEAVRQAFVLAGVDFEDVFIDREKLMELKKTTLPYGQVPVLEVVEGGKSTIIAQSAAILTFVCNKFGLTPKDLLEEARVNEIREHINDLSNKVIVTMREKDEDKKKAAREELAATTLPEGFEQLCKRIQPSGFCVGSKITAADLALSGMYAMLKSGRIDHIPVELIDKYDLIKKCNDNVVNDPKIKAWHDAKAAKVSS